MDQTSLTPTEAGSTPANSTPTEQAAAPIQAPRKKPNWTFITITILAILAGAILGGFGVYYTLGQNQTNKTDNHDGMTMTPTPTAMVMPTATPTPTPTPTPSTVTDATAGWKTFNSTTLSYSVQYPESLGYLDLSKDKGAGKLLIINTQDAIKKMYGTEPHGFVISISDSVSNPPIARTYLGEAVPESQIKPHTLSGERGEQWVSEGLVMTAINYAGRTYTITHQRSGNLADTYAKMLDTFRVK